VKDAGMAPFIHLFPEQGTAEMRTFIIRGAADLPDDEYGLLELYCMDAGCHCRRVLLNVVGRRQQAVLASVSYAFDPNDEWPGPFLDPLNPQSSYAGVLLDLTAQILADPDYVARLEAHYNQVKAATGDPTQPGLRRLPRPAVPSRARPPRSWLNQQTRRSR